MQRRGLKSQLGISTVTVWTGRSFGCARGAFKAGCLLRSPAAAEDTGRQQKSVGRGAAQAHACPVGEVCPGGFAIAQLRSPKEEQEEMEKR